MGRNGETLSGSYEHSTFRSADTNTSLAVTRRLGIRYMRATALQYAAN